MKRLFPFLFLLVCSLQPVINFITANIVDASCSITRSIAYLFILFGLSSTLYLLLHKLLKVEQRYSFLFSGLCVLLIFNFFFLEKEMAVFLDGYRFRHFIICALASLLILGGITKFLSKREKMINILLVFIISFIGADMSLYLKSLDFNEAIKLSDNTFHHNEREKPFSNVYYIIPDMFIGPQAFKHFSGQELQIPQQLEQRGFQVTYDTFSSASSTRTSLAQVFAMDYILAQYQSMGSSSMKAMSDVFLGGESPLIKGFKDRGYKYIRFADGYVSMCDSKENECYHKSLFFNTQDVRFLERTKMISFLTHFKLKGNTLQFPSAMEADEFIKYLPQKEHGPYFLLAHLSLPHPPIRYDQECHFYPEGTAEYAEFNDKYEFGETQKERFDSVIPQIRCSEKLLIKLVDEIQKRDPEGIIILQADHGTASQKQAVTRIEDFSKEQFFENFNILSAFHLPQECRKYIQDGFAPVNNFRVVFGCIDGVEPELLAQRSFVTYYTQLSIQNGEKMMVKEWSKNNA